MTPKEEAREARPLSQGASWGLQWLMEKRSPWEGRRQGTEKTGALGGPQVRVAGSKGEGSSLGAAGVCFPTGC